MNAAPSILQEGVRPNDPAPTAIHTRRLGMIRWLRRYHGWVGLWGAVFGLLMGGSGILLNHRATLKIPAVQSLESKVELPLPQPVPESAEALGEWLRGNLDLQQGSVRTRVEPERSVPWGDRSVTQPEHWQITLTTPRTNVQADWWVGNRFITLKRSDGNLFAMWTNLHKGVGLRAPWVLLVDTAAGSILFLSVTGFLLWMLLHRHRLAGGLLSATALALIVYLAMQSL
jgi:hypothetical protein